MRGVGEYPYGRWAKLTRREARECSRLAWLFAPSSLGPALEGARALLGVAPQFGAFAARMATPTALARTAGADLAVLLASTPLAPPMILAIAPRIARVIGDRVLGGTGTDVAPGPVPLSRAEAGLVAYAIARGVAALGGPVSGVIDGLPLERALGTLGDARMIVWSTELSLGDARGLVSLVVPLDAIPLGAPAPRGVPALSIRAHLDVGTARLPARELAAMQIDDVLVPDALWLDPRSARAGHARLSVARSSRAFEITRAGDDAWTLAHPTSAPAPRPPTRGRTSPAMNEPATIPSLYDVDVEIAIELARLELPVAEVSALAPGVVVTTGRLVGEKVAIRAGERVLAWGELVDVDGETGVRITEVARQ